jgi:hypothetical protein
MQKDKALTSRGSISPVPDTPSDASVFWSVGLFAFFAHRAACARRLPHDASCAGRLIYLGHLVTVFKS